ncbi:MAG: hypothetical protein FWE54_06885 [Methanimicrococcus sp.]|nr:hypothetical protein [Methanimicrococcus sp.]
MDYSYIIELYFLVSTLPGIYLATKKYFFVIQNPKYNRFIIKLLFCIPTLTVITLLLSLLPWAVYDILLSDYTQFFIDRFTIYIALLCPSLASIFFIYVLKKYFIRTDIPPEYQPDFMDHELYVYMPHIQILGAAHYHTKYESPKKRDLKELLVQKQIGSLIYNLKILKMVNYTKNGEFIVNKEALEIFQKYDLTGYQIQTITDHNKPPSDSGIFHQIVPLNIMPSFSPKTIVKSKKTPLRRVFVLNDLFYYNSCVMDYVFDFNVTFEVLGSRDGEPYGPQRLWIVSKKVMVVLLKECSQQKRDFIPIILDDDIINKK